MKSLPINLSAIQNIQKYISKTGLDFVLLSKTDAKYITGTNCIVLIPKTSKPIIFLSKLEVNNFSSSDKSKLKLILNHKEDPILSLK